MSRLLEDFAEVSGDWFWEMDSDLRFTYFSSRWEQVFGFSPQREIGKSRLEIAANSDDKSLWQAHVEDLLARRPFRELTYPYRHQNGSIVWLRVSGQPVFGPDGEFTGYRGVGTNVTAEVEAREKLANVLAELKNANAQLELQNVLFDTALNNMHHGLCMWDSDLRIIVCNRRFLEIYGFSADVVKPGVSLHDVMNYSFEIGNYPEDSSVEELYAGAVAELAATQAWTSERWVNGNRIVSVNYRPMANGRWVATYEDITERKRHLEELKRREEKLRVQNERFEAALNNMRSGLSMFDSDQRLIIMNRRYAEFFRLPEELTRPGVLLRQIREHRVEAGCAPIGEKSAFIGADLTGQNAWSYISELEDGRFIAFRSTQMADGGWVGTHEDVTELRRAELSVAVERSRLSAALENMSQGLAMFDSDRKLIVCNDRYAKIYGLPSELIRPGTTQRQVLEHRVAAGTYAGSDPQRYIDERVQNAERAIDSDSILKLSDGRVIAVAHRAMRDGGWVSTHEDVTEQHRSRERIVYLATHDPLTGLPNRSQFRERMDEALARIKRSGQLAVLFIDLDGFKPVNDAFGHAIGDQLLKEVAARLRQCVREIDIVARLGGDEFAIIQTSLEQAENAALLGERIISRISEPLEIEGNQIQVGASVGIAIGPSDGDSDEQLLKHADAALYSAKAAGRGTYRFFKAEMNAHLAARRDFEQELRDALRNGQFELYYQPIVKIATRQPIGFEALMRWNHPERGLVGPSEFISVAEEIGLITQIGEWVLRQACSEAARWPDPLYVAVNLSPVQLKTQGLVQCVANAIAASGLGADRLELEITESVLLNEDEAIIERLRQLHALGVRIAMDDFGTGYSSLSYLRNFPFDKLKIDRSFVSELTTRRECAAIIRALLGMAGSLSIATTAEGVESEEQLQQLENDGCMEAQGYLFGRPQPASQIRELLPALRQRRQPDVTLVDDIRLRNARQK